MAISLGHFAGGVSSGFQAQHDVGLRTRALRLQEEQFLNAQQQQLIEAGDKAIGDTLGIVGKTIQGFKDGQIASGGTDIWREAIASIESAGSGGYQARGPVTRTGDRAYGRYQVMGANVGPWTREVLGREMTPEEFRADPAAQDAVFNTKFGALVQEFGPQDAASVWFTGRPLAAGGATASDGHLTGAEYVERFNAATKNIPAERISRAVAPLMQDVTDLATRIGRDPGQYQRQVDALILSTPSAIDTALAEGRTTAATKLSEAAALEPAVGRERALATAGISEPAAPANIVLRTFQMPDGQFVSVRADNAAAIDQMISGGGVETPRSVQAQNVTGLERATEATPKDVEEARAGVRTMAANLEELNETASRFAATPEAAGVAGLAISKIGGLAQQIGPLDAMMQAAGIDPAEVQAVRTQGIATVSSLLQAITQETSGRYTDTERALANQALGALEPTSSSQQVQAALEQTQRILQRSQLREADRLRVAAGISAADLATDAGIDQMGEILTSNGLTEDMAIGVIADLIGRLGAN